MMSPAVAFKSLVQAGWLRCPARCPKCKVSTLAGPPPRHDVDSADKHLYCRCSNWTCKARTNVLAGQKWLNVDRFKGLTPSILLCVLSAYTSSMVPPTQFLWSLTQNGIKEGTLVKLLDALRELESQAHQLDAFFFCILLRAQGLGFSAQGVGIRV